MPQLSYTPTVYEQIVIDMLDKKTLGYAKYRDEWEKRGWNEKQFQSYVNEMQQIKKIVEAPNFNLRAAMDIVRQKESIKKDDLIFYRLLPEERQILLEMEDVGRIKAGDVIKYKGFETEKGKIGDYEGEIRGYDYLDLPEDTDAFVVFSGHPEAARPATLAWLAQMRKTGKPTKLVFLGLHDNQGNTSFNENGLKFVAESEAEMYRRCMQAMGIPQEIIDSCVITPTDISTADNIELLAVARQKYFAAKKSVKFAMFSYPGYQKRVASEFALGFQRLRDAGKVEKTEFVIPDVEPEKDFAKRNNSYDNDVMQGIVAGNTSAHIYRDPDPTVRYNSELGAYPEHWKKVIPVSLGYSYPNVPNELAGTSIKVATMMKLHTALQLKAYGWEAPQKTEDTIEAMIMRTKRDAVRVGLNSAWLMKNGNKLTGEEYVAKYGEFTAYQKMREIDHQNDHRPSIKQRLKDDRLH